MIVRKQNRIYSSKVKYVRGSGFMDVMRNIGSYISQNRDLIAQPLLKATGEAAGIVLTEGTKAIMNKIANKNNRKKLDSESEMILNSLLSDQNSLPVANIIGSGIKKF